MTKNEASNSRHSKWINTVAKLVLACQQLPSHMTLSFTDEVVLRPRYLVKRNVCTSLQHQHHMYYFSYYIIRTITRTRVWVPRKLEPRKLILTTISSISRIFPPTKITRCMVCGPMPFILCDMKVSLSTNNCGS